jgi:hypothetical protein
MIQRGVELTGECPAVVGGGGEDVITRGVQGQAGHRTLVHRQHLEKKGLGHQIEFKYTDKN